MSRGQEKNNKVIYSNTSVERGIVMRRRCEKTHLSLFFLFFFCFVSTAHAAPDLNQPLQWDKNVLRGKLPNGFSYYIRENKKPEKRVQVTLAVKAGSLLEEDGTEGLAHFLEHMGFNGTEHFEPEQLFKYFESIGADPGPDSNAYTFFDRTVYYLKVPTEKQEHVEKALLAMHDFAAGMKFLPEEIEKERGVVLEEERLSRGLYMRLLEKALEIAAKNTRYAKRIVIGKPESIKKITREDFLSFYKKWYRPDTMGLIVVGDINKSDMEKKIKEIFGKIPKPKDAPDVPLYGDIPHNEIYTGVITDKELPASGAVVVKTFPKKISRTAGDYREKLLEDIGIDILNTRLNELMQSKKPPFLQAMVMDVTMLRGMDILGVGGIARGKESTALKAVLEEIKRIEEHGVLKEEVDEVLKDWEESFRVEIQEKEKTDSGAYAYGLTDAFIGGGTETDVEYRYKLFQQLKPTLTLDAAQKAVKELFSPVNMAVGAALPEAKKGKFTEEDIKNIMAEVEKKELAPYTLTTKTKSTDYSALVPGKIVKQEEVKELGVTRLVFENGLIALLKPTNFQKDEIMIDSYSLRGSLLETPENRGIAGLTSGSWISGGTKDFTAFEISRMQKGKSISFWADSVNSLGASTVGKDFEETLQWMHDYLTIPGFREEAVMQAKDATILSIKNGELNQDTAFYKAANKLTCYGNPITIDPKEQDVEQVKAEDVRNFYDLTRATTGIQYTFVGNFDVKKITPLIAKYLGSLPKKEAPVIHDFLKRCAFPEGFTRREIYKGMEKRSLVEIIFPGTEAYSADVPALRVLSKVGSNRLSDSLREKLGGTYYAYLSAWEDAVMKGKSSVSVNFATDPDKVESLLKSAYEVLETLKNDAPTDMEMRRVIEVIKKDHEEDLKENSYWLYRLSGADILGIPLDYSQKLYEVMLKVAPDDVKKMAQKYFSATRVEVIAFPEKR